MTPEQVSERNAPEVDKREIPEASATNSKLSNEYQAADIQPGSEIVHVIDDETTIGKVLELVNQDDPDETLDEVELRAQHSQYSSLGKDLFEREKSQGDLTRRSKQAILHVTFTEMRISQLEKEIRKLECKISGVPDDFLITNRGKECAVCEPVLKRSRDDEFRLTTYSTEIPPHQRPALEALTTERVKTLRSEDDLQTPSRRSTGLIGLDQELVTTHKTPEKLRIRSMPLIAHLEKVCGEALSNSIVWGNVSYTHERRSPAPVVLLRPFKLLVVYEKEIRESLHGIETLLQSTDHGKEKNGVKKGSCKGGMYENSNLLQHLKLLIEFLDVELKPTFTLRQSIRDGTATHIEYADLWHLFEIGDVVIARTNQVQAFRVVNFTGGRDILISSLDSEKSREQPYPVGFVVDCCRICFDGTNYVPELKTFSIQKFNGRRPITSLDVFPLKFDGNASVLRQRLISQGRQYLDFTRSSFSHKMFRGKTLDEPPQELDGQVIVDIAMAINIKPEWRQKKRISERDLTISDPRETHMQPFCQHSKEHEGCCGSDYIFKDLKMNHPKISPFGRDYQILFRTHSTDEIEEEDQILLPNWVYGFVLRNRQWVKLKMADLSEVKFENEFDELMLSDSHKETILALVGTHENTRTSSGLRASTVGAALDLVKGKGNGLIILLHGEPGVGKTSTAECVADKTRRPLYPITCGDIGETGKEVEDSLLHNFRLAHKWGCVLLLDEADVFLAKRNKTDLRRNVVTSVFLRSLEYYAGILFLTTNRVGGIDPAFKSRIHLSLYYPRIDINTTLKLYKVFLRRTREEQQRSGIVRFKIKDKEIIRFAERHFRRLEKDGFNTWNGRQIRNAFQTAIALVEHEANGNGVGESKPSLSKLQFQTVAKGSKEFDNYLIKTLQGPDDEIARRDQWRDDRFDTGGTLNTASTSRTVHKSSHGAFQSAISSESDESEAETESEDEDEDENRDENSAEIKSKARVSNVASKASSKGYTDSKVDINDLEDFIRYKAMLNGKGKRT